MTLHDGTVRLDDLPSECPTCNMAWEQLAIEQGVRVSLVCSCGCELRIPGHLLMFRFDTGPAFTFDAKPSDLLSFTIEASSDEETFRKCRRCGCTDADCSGCAERTGEPCHWVELDLCSACAAEEGTAAARVSDSRVTINREPLERLLREVDRLRSGSLFTAGAPVAEAADRVRLAMAGGE